jgi:hypothetical protein
MNSNKRKEISSLNITLLKFDFGQITLCCFFKTSKQYDLLSLHYEDSKKIQYVNGYLPPRKDIKWMFQPLLLQSSFIQGHLRFYCEIMVYYSLSELEGFLTKIFQFMFYPSHMHCLQSGSQVSLYIFNGCYMRQIDIIDPVSVFDDHCY